MPQKRRSSARGAEPDASDGEREPPSQRRRISQVDEDEGYDEEDRTLTQDDGNQEQMVKNLVRLALACEYTRMPLRRSDITAKVLGTHSRQFKAVFAKAQQHLRHVFGMEMAELPVREKVTIQQKRAAAKSQSQKSQTQASNAWILTTVLPEQFRAPDILRPPQAPTSEAESQYCALSSFIVSMIMLSSGTLSEGKLERYLTRANVNEVTPFTNSVTFNSLDKTEKLLKKMEKDGFIVKVRDTAGGDEVIEYIVGPRGKIEVGQAGVEGLVRAVYGDVDDPEDLKLRLRRSLSRAQARTQEETSAAG